MIGPRFHRLWWTAGWVTVAAVVLVSLLPNPQIPGPDLPWRDKWGHLLAWGWIMGWFCQLDEPAPVRARRLIMLALLGAGLEVAQSFYPQREGDVVDVVANVSGLVLGWLVGRRLSHGRKG